MAQDGTQFEILNRVDVGGMAEIFRARNLDNGEIMAIKRILPHLSEKREFVTMFIDEAAICLVLHHPNIVRVDQIGLMDDALFLSMEFVDGANLREILNFANRYHFFLPIHEAVRIAILVLDGLDYAHHCCDESGKPLNLIHRDVSPPNILLGYNGDVKITDFGLVKSKAQVSHTSPGLIKGKFSYLSPEAAYGESLDLRSDLYSVGIILWEMLTSQPLFAAPVEMDILDLVRKSIIPDIASRHEGVPAELETIVKKALARNREDRYQSAKEFADQLRLFLQNMGNPSSDLGNIVASIQPPRYLESVDISLDDLGSTKMPHTKSCLIPLNVLDKKKMEAALAESFEQNSSTNASPMADQTAKDDESHGDGKRVKLPDEDDLEFIELKPEDGGGALEDDNLPLIDDLSAPVERSKDEKTSTSDAHETPEDAPLDGNGKKKEILKRSVERHIDAEMVKLDDLPLATATRKPLAYRDAQGSVSVSQVVLLIVLILIVILLILLNIQSLNL